MLPKQLSPAPSYGLFYTCRIQHQLQASAFSLNCWYILWLNAQDALSKFVNMNYNYISFADLWIFCDWIPMMLWAKLLNANYNWLVFFKTCRYSVTKYSRFCWKQVCEVIISHELFHCKISCYSYQIYRLLVICVAAQKKLLRSKGRQIWYDMGLILALELETLREDHAEFLCGTAWLYTFKLYM